MTLDLSAAALTGWSDPAVPTSDQAITPGPALRHGTEGAYHRLTVTYGEHHQVRGDLGTVDGGIPGRRRRSLLHLAHLTDVQLTDTQSPGRLEFLQRSHDEPRFAWLFPSYRPQEFLVGAALEATVRTLNALPRSALTGAPVQVVLSTGDNIDNGQFNELGWWLRLVNGGPVSLRSGGPAYEGVQTLGDEGYWRPDPRPDCYKERWGFPSYPGLLEAATDELLATGLRLPWLSCYGNHDGLAQGRAPFNAGYRTVVTGDRKAFAVPASGDVSYDVADFIARPERYLTGGARQVAPDPERRPVSRREYVEAHFLVGGTPHGHGFTGKNLRDGTAYYAYDATPTVKLVVLDTTNPGGFQDGSIGARQLAWLEAELTACSSRYWSATDELVETGNHDRLVVLCSHHGLETLNNPLVGDPAEDLPRHVADEVEALVHRFPNVVLWLSGHTHVNRIRPRHAPAGRAGGFWEVTTSSLMEWPCQTRTVELVDAGDGNLVIRTTMFDHGAPVLPPEAVGLEWLASVHRELAANDPLRGFRSDLAGQERDRNIDLLLPAPLPLESMTGMP